MFSVFKRPFGKKAQNTPETDPAVQEGTVKGPPVNLKMHGAAKVHEKFPQVRSIAVNLMISPPNNDVEPTLNGRSFGPDSLAFFEFRCKNVECFDGGFDITDAITDAIERGEKTLTGRRVCHGWHGKHRVNQVRCHYDLNYRVNINYYEN